MIGVIANPTEEAAVCEFFELFKTPWEFYQNGRQYEVLLYAGDAKVDQHPAKLVLIYAGRKLPLDAQEEVDTVCGGADTRTLSYKGTEIPIYGDSVTFREKKSVLLVDTKSQQPAAYLDQSGGRAMARIGYDLFREISALLTVGQPACNASIPALDLHIALLRDLIVASGVLLVEIPPVPQGYQFIACLTHDVDHASIRRHRLDFTMFGFVYRAVICSTFNVIRRRTSIADLLTNWAAVLKLPFVYLGLAKDFWLGFGRYPALERGMPSSFFVIPFRGRPGRTKNSRAPKSRGSAYGAADIADQLHALMSAGCEIGLHGIDAWFDSTKGREELEEIRRITGTNQIGARMHWLYGDERTSVALERAGADYDSTIGYNETVGFRAGTGQAYKPLKTTRLLELPMHIMDTALFFPVYLDLSFGEASQRIGPIINHAVETGGTVTVNWHDRSIAPDRLWGNFYVGLVDELESKGAWFATARQAVSWFRKRRSAAFEVISGQSGTLRLKLTLQEDERDEGLPGLILRVHRPGEPRQDHAINSAVTLSLPSEMLAGRL